MYVTKMQLEKKCVKKMEGLMIVKGERK